MYLHIKNNAARRENASQQQDLGGNGDFSLRQDDR